MVDDLRLFLDGAYEALAEASRLQERCAELRARAEKVTTQLTGMPHGGNADSERLLALLADEQEKANARLAVYQEKYHAIERFIDSIEGPPNWRIVLRLRYLECLQWDSVLSRLNRTREPGYEYSERRMYQLHGEALAAARKVFENYKEDCKHD